MIKIVIACAGSKQGEYFRTSDGKKVKFVAQRKPPSGDFLFPQPDDPSDLPGKTWRELVEDSQDQNPFRLCPAYLLYTPKQPWRDIYTKLVAKFTKENVFVLSAGWGLIRSDFLTPNYDITFTPQAERYKRRDANDPFCKDFRQLAADAQDEIFLFASKAYLPLFCKLTAQNLGQRNIFYNGAKPTGVRDCHLIPCNTSASRATQRTWYYSCADDFLVGRFREIEAPAT